MRRRSSCPRCAMARRRATGWSSRRAARSTRSTSTSTSSGACTCAPVPTLRARTSAWWPSRCTSPGFVPASPGTSVRPRAQHGFVRSSTSWRRTSSEVANPPSRGCAAPQGTVPRTTAGGGRPVGQVNANGIDVHYDVHGDGDNGTVLLVCGTGQPVAVWSLLGVVDALVHAGRRVVTFENRGMAGAACPTPPWTVGDMADDALAVLAEVGPAHVHGVSLGALITQT